MCIIPLSDVTITFFDSDNDSACQSQLSASVVQWLKFLPIDQKVMSLNPGQSKGVLF